MGLDKLKGEGSPPGEQLGEDSSTELTVNVGQLITTEAQDIKVVDVATPSTTEEKSAGWGAGLIFPKRSKYRDKKWHSLMNKAKRVLNVLALNEYREAPFLQWALVSIDHATRHASRGAVEEFAEYLKLTFSALQYAKQLAESPLRNNEEDHSPRRKQEVEILTRAMEHLESAFDRSLRYRLDSNLANLQRAKISLRQAVKELAAAEKNLTL